MEKRQLSVSEVSVLLWLKALDEFNSEGYENASFDKKFEAFVAVEAAGFTREEYDKNVGFWIKQGIIDVKKDTNEYLISKKGKKLFEQIDKLKDADDEEVRETVNNILSLSLSDKIINYVKAHPQEVIGVIGIALQLTQIVIAV